MSDDTPASPGWWVLSGEDLLYALRRTHDGEDPALVYAEMYANSEHEHVDRGDSNGA